MTLLDKLSAAILLHVSTMYLCISVCVCVCVCTSQVQNTWMWFYRNSVNILVTKFFKKWVSPGGSDGKASAYSAGDPGTIPGWGRSPGEGNGKPHQYSSVQFSSVAQSCLTLCDPINRSTPGLPVHHQLPEFTQTHVHLVSDAIQLSHPLLFPSPHAPNRSQHQSLFQWVNSSHEVAKVLEFQL